MKRQIVRAPIYQQLNQALRELLREGEFVEGDQFLTERQICERFDVSRATANKALSNLVASSDLGMRDAVLAILVAFASNMVVKMGLVAWAGGPRLGLRVWPPLIAMTLAAGAAYFLV